MLPTLDTIIFPEGRFSGLTFEMVLEPLRGAIVLTFPDSAPQDKKKAFLKALAIFLQDGLKASMLENGQEVVVSGKDSHLTSVYEKMSYGFKKALHASISSQTIASIPPEDLEHF